MAQGKGSGQGMSKQEMLLAGFKSPQHNPGHSKVRYSKLLLMGDEVTLRHVKSGSVKNKLNLENTKLRNNIDNLTSHINLRQQNEQVLKVELDKYRQKIRKYKDKVKQKESIIAKLIKKIEDGGGSIVIDFQNIGQKSKFHTHKINHFKSSLSDGHKISPQQILKQYQELSKHNQHQSKLISYLQNQNQSYQNKIRQLQSKLQQVGVQIENSSFPEIQKVSEGEVVDKAQIKKYENLLDQQKGLRLVLMQKLQGLSIQLQPQYKQLANKLESLRDAKPETVEQQQNKALEQLTLQRIRNNKLQTQLHQNTLKLKQSDEKLGNLINQIQSISIDSQNFSKFKQQFQYNLIKSNEQSQKINQLTQKLQQTKQKFTELIKLRETDKQQWSALQLELNQRIDQSRSKIKQLQDKNDFETRKRRKFQLSLLTYDPYTAQLSETAQKPTDQYLDEKIQQLKKNTKSIIQENKDLKSNLRERQDQLDILGSQYTQLQEQIIFKNQKLKSLGQYPQQRSSDQGLDTEVDIDQIMKKRIEPSVDWNLPKNAQIIQNIQTKANNLSEQSLKDQYKKVAKNEHNLKTANQVLSCQNLKHLLEQQKLKNKLQKLQQQLQSISSLRTPQKPQDSDIIIQNHQEKTLFVLSQAQKIIAENKQPSLEQYKKITEDFKQLAQNHAILLNEVKTKQVQLSQQYGSHMKRKDQHEISGHQQHDQSQDMIEDSYKNINEELERLSLKCQQLQSQKGKIKQENDDDKKKLQAENQNLKSKIRMVQKVNSDMTKLIVHLENQRNKLTQGADQSSDEMRGDDSISHKLDQLKVLTQQHQKLIQQQPQNQQQEQERKKKIEQIEQQITQLNLGMKSSINQGRQSGDRSSTHEKQLANYQNIIKTNAQLINKLKNADKQKKQRDDLLHSISESIKQQKMHQNLSPQEMKNKFYEMKEKCLQHQGQIDIVRKNAQQQQKLLKQTKDQINQIMQVVQEKQRQNLMLQAQVIRKYAEQGASEEQKIRLNDILENFDKKLQDMENNLSQKKIGNQPSREDLFDTINYLNEQNQILKNQNGHLYDNLTKYQGQLPIQDKGQQAKLSIMAQNQQLKQKYAELQQKSVRYFNMIENGEGAQIIRQKDQMIEELSENVIDAQAQNAYLKKQKNQLQKQISKIENQLKQIQKAVSILTGSQSPDDSQKASQTNINETIASLGVKTKSLSSKYQKYQQQLIHLKGLPEGSQITSLNQQTLQKIRQLLAIVNDQDKNQKPFEKLPINFEQVPQLNQLLQLFTDYLNNIWILIQQRTAEYNQLRDQMNLISMDCLKAARMEQNSQKDQSGNYKQIDVIQQRYQEVLAELIEYQSLNKRLQRQVMRLREEVHKYKKQLQQIHSKFLVEIRSESSSQCQYNEQVLRRIFESEQKMDIGPKVGRQYPEIIKLLLLRIQDLETKLQMIHEQFENKNKKFDSIIQRELSFQSERSARQLDKSSISDRQSRRKQQIILQGSFDKSVSGLNSAQIFKEIQQLAKANDQIRQQSKNRYVQLQNVKQRLINALNNEHNQILRNEVNEVINFINQMIQRQGNSQIYGSIKMQQKYSEDVPPVFEITNIGSVKKTIKTPNQNRELIEQNKEQFDQIINKIANKISSMSSQQTIRQILINKINKQDIKQAITNKEGQDQIIEKFVQIVDVSQSSQIKGGEQSWVDGQQIQAVIDKIYPNRSDLCNIISSGLIGILGAQSSLNIVNSVKNMFQSLNKKQKQILLQFQKKDEQMADYARNMSKILMAKSSESAGSIHQLGLEMPFRKTTQIKSEYQIKKEQQGSEDYIQQDQQ